MSSRPAMTASSTTYWIAGLSTMGSISLGCAFVTGRNRVPSPAAGMTALRARTGSPRVDIEVILVGLVPLACPHHAVAALRLGLVHRRVGAAQQPGDGGAMPGMLRDADAAGHRHRRDVGRG